MLIDPHQPNPTLNDLDYKARRILVLGTTGTGKTTLASRLISLHPADLVLIYDWQGGEFRQRLGVAGAFNRDQFADQIASGKRIVAYDAESEETDPTRDGWEWFCRTCLDVGRVTAGTKLVVADECQDLVTPHDVPAPMKELLAKGRRARIDTLLLGSAANGLHNTNRDQVSEVFCFRSIDGNALKYPESIGLDPDEIQALPDCHFLYRNLRTGEKKRLALWEKKSTASETQPKET